MCHLPQSALNVVWDIHFHFDNFFLFVMSRHNDEHQNLVES